MRPVRNLGFTLIELMLYVSIIGGVILVVSLFLSVIQRQGIRNQVVSEVELQSIESLQVMTQIIRNASAIVSPATGASSASASVTMLNDFLSPTIFTATSGAITLKEGTASAIALTSEKIIVSDIIFTNLSAATSPGTLRIQYTVSYNNPDTQPEYSYSNVTTGSATLR